MNNPLRLVAKCVDEPEFCSLQYGSVFLYAGQWLLKIVPDLHRNVNCVDLTTFKLLRVGEHDTVKVYENPHLNLNAPA